MNVKFITYISRFLLLLSFFLTIITCKQKPFEGIKAEGKITYDITYKKIDLDKIPEKLLPQKMTLLFSNRYTKNIIEGYAGIISIQNINDLKMDTVTTSFKFFNHKYYYTSKPKESPCCFEILEKPIIKFENDSIQIAGFNCYRASIEYPKSGKKHTIYYTMEIDAGIINKNTAYEKVPGILMDFEMEMGSLTMQFKASEINFQNIEMKEFSLRDGYKKISRDDMVKIIDQLLE